MTFDTTDNAPGSSEDRAGVDSGPLLVMGARHNASTDHGAAGPRMLSALHAETLQPLLAEWSYEGDSTWTRASQWIDREPSRKLFVRSADDAGVLNPANIIGNGLYQAIGSGAFVALRDERGFPAAVDMVAWGIADAGGELDRSLSELKNVVEVSCTSLGYAARLRDHRVVCWGTGAVLDDPDDYLQVRSSRTAFVGQKRDGRLHAWGSEAGGVPVPAEVAQHRDYVELCGAYSAFAARRASGHVLAWGSELSGGRLAAGQDSLDDIVQLIGNFHAFAALRSSAGQGRVIAWGLPAAGGVPPAEISELDNVRCLAASTRQAFAVILHNDAVRAWGHEAYGGKVPDEVQGLTGVLEVSASHGAFCARLSSGQVVAWPQTRVEGRLPRAIAELTNVVQVVGSGQSFAALCRDGRVHAWGNPDTGGDTAAVAAQLFDVRAVYGNANSFAALTADGRVVTWGFRLAGGDSDAVQAQLTGKVTTGYQVPLAEVQRLFDEARHDRADS